MTHRLSKTVRPLGTHNQRPAGSGLERTLRAVRSDWRVRSQSLKAPFYWTDAWMMSALLLALIFVMDPFGLRFEKISVTKHLPLLIGCFALTTTMIGSSLNTNRDWIRHGGVVRAAAPFLVLAIWIIAGSLYARYVDHLNDTFLTVGLYMLAVPGVAAFMVATAARWRVVGIYMRALSVAGAYMILRMVAEHVTSGGVYHELEFLVVPLGVFYALRPRGNGRWNARLTIFFLLGGLTFLKLTGFIAVSIALAYLWMVEWRFRFRESPKFRSVVMRSVAAGTLLCVAMAVAVVSRPDKIVPSGNPGYRLITYQHALHRFIVSPIYGSSFDASATSHFKAFQIQAAHGELATHSDLLDLAANGGLLALALLFWANVRVLGYARRSIFARRVTDEAGAAAHALACMSLTGILVYAFNPILLQPDRALLLWSSTGLLLGMALSYKQGRTISDSEC
jgi:hypothetical protein